MRAALGALAALAIVVAPSAGADVYVLTDGDRVTGKTVFKGQKTFTVQTPYGRLIIPRAKVERIVHDDGREEVLNPPPAPPPPPEPTPPLHMILVITGKTFWYAWDPPKGVTVDPTLRLQVTLDEVPIATYVDARLDPDEIPGAAVNAFSFLAADIAVTTGSGAQLPMPPEARPGRIVLRIDLPPEKAGHHRLRLAYQVDEGSEAEPAWRDMAEASLDLDLKPDSPTFVQVQQDPGRMEFSGLGRHKMKNVDSFRLLARAESP